MDLPALEDFAPLLGGRFELAVETDLRVTAELVTAQALPQPAFNGRQAFTLIFAGPPAPVLPQRIYRLAHDKLPAIDVFLVPVAADAGGVRYQAIFS